MTVLLFRAVHDVEHLGPVRQQKGTLRTRKRRARAEPVPTASKTAHQKRTWGASSSSFSSSSSSFHSRTRRSQARGPSSAATLLLQQAWRNRRGRRRLTTSIFFLELRLPLLLLLRLLRLPSPTSVPPPPHLSGAAGETAPGGTAQPRRPGCRPEPAVRGGAPGQAT